MTNGVNANSTIQQIAYNDPDLIQQVSLDLAMRARGGIAIYLAVWSITAVWADIIQTNPTFFYFNTFVLATISIMRASHYILFTRYHFNSHKMYTCLVSLILIGALHWGLMSAWIIFTPSYQLLHTPYMIILAAVAIGGSAILSISGVIRVWFPLFIFIPSFATGIFIGGAEYYVLAILLVFALFYIFEASRVSLNDYGNAISCRKEADTRAKEMELLSITDPLTGLNNRMHFNDKFLAEWNRCGRLKLPLSIMMVDLDNFKQLNDSYGHLAGDKCLREVPKVMKAEIKRDTNSIARYGGEEFVVILSGQDLAASTKFAQKLINNIAKINLTWEQKHISVSCSVGLASMIPDKYINSQLLLKAADDAMYQAKHNGRNQYYVAQDLVETTKISQVK